jgi:hypothetical protein
MCASDEFVERAGYATQRVTWALERKAGADDIRLAVVMRPGTVQPSVVADWPCSNASHPTGSASMFPKHRAIAPLSPPSWRDRQIRTIGPCSGLETREARQSRRRCTVRAMFASEMRCGAFTNCWRM